MKPFLQFLPPNRLKFISIQISNQALAWILETGFWDDSGIWDDTANWIDSI